MKELKPHNFDIQELKTELKEFENLLNRKTNLQEQADILPFFKAKLNLSVFIGSFSPYISKFDRVAHELSLGGDFTCDLVCGDSVAKKYCLVELEDAVPNSIFRKTKNKQNSEWSPRFDHGYSQLIDWLWKLESMRNGIEFENLFGSRNATFSTLLIIGRESNLNQIEKNRLTFRLDKVLVNSVKINCLTYDQLCKLMKDKIYITI